MTDTLIQAYLPLLLWSGLGLLIFRVLPDAFPRMLGRALYWVGVPLEIGVLARESEFAQQVGWVPIFAVGTLIAGLLLSWLSLNGLSYWLSRRQSTNTQPELTPELSQPNSPPLDDREAWAMRSRRGGFIVSSMIGNTGFVGLAIAPVFVDEQALSWVVLYSVIHNVVGTYGLGVYIASYFGRSTTLPTGWLQIRDVLTVPSLWAFAVGYASRPIALNPVIETVLHRSIWVVIPMALLLMGMRLSQLNGWKSLKLALLPMTLKIFVLPAMVGLIAVLVGLPAYPRLALVLMSGMPTAFAGLILAEEYDLDRELIAGSVVLTTGMLLLTIPIWLVLFGSGDSVTLGTPLLP
ncbi:MAG TPA: AEC family transporter [Elainellaceae cyanobacterium]